MTRDIMLLVIYTFIFTSAFMHCSDTIRYENESLTWNVSSSESK